MEKVLDQSSVDAFHRDGFLVIDSGFSHKLLDRVVRDIERLYDPDQRKTQTAGIRVQDAWKQSRSAQKIATAPYTLAALQQLFGRKPRPFQTLNFPVATQQACHSDIIHFNSMPSGFMAGVWVALEDIDENNGPLVYYPGSHKMPEYTMQDANLKAGYEHYPAYEKFIDAKIRESGLQPALGTIRKGQAIIWHANLVHGGSEQKDHSRSRHSQVTHYYFEGCRYYTPLLSLPDEPHYRDPQWIATGPISSLKRLLARIIPR